MDMDFFVMSCKMVIFAVRDRKRCLQSGLRRASSGKDHKKRVTMCFGNPFYKDK